MSTTTPSTPTRLVDGAVLPAAGTWDIDPVHADVAFTGRHFMVTKVRGRFTDISGAVVVGEDMNDSRVDVVIAIASVESGSVVRDDHLRSPEMFDVEQFPQMTFRSVSVDWHGTRGVVQGDLTLHGVTRRVPLEVTFEGHVRDPWGGDRAIFSATTAG
jgi:polyisoprenoid-binding protein YceI